MENFIFCAVHLTKPGQHRAIARISLKHFAGNTAKGRISKRLLQENKARQFFQKTNISYPLIRTRTCARKGKKWQFFGKLGVLCFLETPVMRFAFLPHYQRFLDGELCNNIQKLKSTLIISIITTSIRMCFKFCRLTYFVGKQNVFITIL